jgi:hypothetical protein
MPAILKEADMKSRKASAKKHKKVLSSVKTLGKVRTLQQITKG